MKGTPEQAPGITPEGENKPEEEKTFLVFYKKEKKIQISPPLTRKISWFWTPELLSSLQERGALEEIKKRIGDFCHEEGKKMMISLFTGVTKTGREETLIMVEVSRELLSKQTREILMLDAPEPPRQYLLERED